MVPQIRELARLATERAGSAENFMWNRQFFIGFSADPLKFFRNPLLVVKFASFQVRLTRSRTRVSTLTKKVCDRPSYFAVSPR